MENLGRHFEKLLNLNIHTRIEKVPIDYFSWGRDKRHKVENTEQLPIFISKRKLINKYLGILYSVLTKPFGDNKSIVLSRFRRRYSSFNTSYLLMADDYSKNLFVELILMMLIGERKFRLSSFTQDFINSYEIASDQLLESDEELRVYNWILKRISLKDPSVSFYTSPTFLNLHYNNRLYMYQRNNVVIQVEEGDTVIDAGVGWGDTSVYLASKARNVDRRGCLYAFDILEEGLDALSRQIILNPGLNIQSFLFALSDRTGDIVSISSPSPGARIVKEETRRQVETITIDDFVDERSLKKVDFIKMDIEGAEVPALKGATNTIKKFKPKLAVCVYHKWDDLLIIPTLINNIRSDYKYYLDCTTGFGGEAVLYCK